MPDFLLKTGRIERGREQLEEVILDIQDQPALRPAPQLAEIWRARWLLFRTRGGIPDRSADSMLER